MRLISSFSSSKISSSSCFASLNSSDEVRYLELVVGLSARSTNGDDRDYSVHDSWCRVKGAPVRHG
jgi:hypothetical protein